MCVTAGAVIQIHARITHWASTKAQVGAKFLFHNKASGSWNYFTLLKPVLEFLWTSSKIIARGKYWTEGLCFVKPLSPQENQSSLWIMQL